MEERIQLQVSGLVKRFGTETVLNGIDLDVHKGEVVVVLGPSGCGKSTLLRCMNGLEPLTEGTIRLDGEEITTGGKKITQLRQKIGMVFQSYDLFPHKTVLENILLAPLKVQKRDRAEAEREAMELLERVGLAGRKDDYPRCLSGGQKQRIAIVRALIMHPEILLLDEITAALDPEMVHEVLEVVLSLARSGSTMMIVTHEMAFARAAADRVILLENGEIVEESSSPGEFFAHPRTRRGAEFLHSFEYSGAEKEPG